MPFETPDLPYAYDALAPYIDEETMHLHHDKHHVGYTTKLNKAVEGSEYESWSVEDLLRRLNDLPEKIRTPVRNHGGGHYNHALFWRMMAPNAGGEPTGEPADAIKSTFGSFDDFREQFKATATGRFGSGWGWLVVNARGGLELVSTPNQDNPITDGLTPILGIDVWEHAYYLSYRNRRAEYVDNFFHVVNWDEVARLYREARS
ncbi:MAG: superoxide dismutase [Spirochaetaceae bacterium]